MFFPHVSRTSGLLRKWTTVKFSIPKKKKRRNGFYSNNITTVCLLSGDFCILIPKGCLFLGFCPLCKYLQPNVLFLSFQTEFFVFVLFLDFHLVHKEDKCWGLNSSKGKLIVTRGNEWSPAGLPEAFKDVVNWVSDRPCPEMALYVYPGSKVEHLIRLHHPLSVCLSTPW